MRSNACADFTRSEMLRSAAARAGDGLPTIEPGMPTPAGTGLTRRSMLLKSAGLALSVYGAGALGPKGFDAGVAAAVAASPDRPVLLSVFLSGGLDGLSLLAPVDDPRYRALRPTLKVDPGSGPRFAGDDRLQWHPSAAALERLHTAGRLTVAPAIGYSDTDQSHFTTRHYWEVGETSALTRTGWLGRYLDQHGSPDNPLQGLSLGGLNPALATASVPVAAVNDPRTYSLWAEAVDSGRMTDTMLDAFAGMGAGGGDPAVARAKRSVSTAGELNDTLRPFRNGAIASAGSVPYPAGIFPQRLAAVAAMLGSGLPMRCLAIDGPGNYDMHSGQAHAFPIAVRLTADSLEAFQSDLEARGIADRVVTLVWSEFGRRPAENGQGTDHGAAGVSMLMGSRVRGETLGEFPGLASLDARDNLRSTFDFRSIYCSLLEQWMGVDAAPLIPGAAGFARPVLFN